MGSNERGFVPPPSLEDLKNVNVYRLMENVIAIVNEPVNDANRHNEKRSNLLKAVATV